MSFHVDRSGRAARCTATKRPCPLGGTHYATLSEARLAAEVQLAREFSQEPTPLTIAGGDRELLVQALKEERLTEEELKLVLHSLEAFKAAHPLLSERPALINIPKRAGKKESLSDARNTYFRSQVDRLFGGSSYSQARGWQFSMKLFEGKCYVCKQDVAVYRKTRPEAKQQVVNVSLGHLEGDHIVPPELGGTSTPGNMAPVHSSCNKRKGSTPPEEFFASDPATLKKIAILQRTFAYRPPPPEIFLPVKQQLDALWAEFEEKTLALQAPSY